MGTERATHVQVGASPLTLSVIVPTLNEEAEVAAALLSARAPAVCEILVVDGGSSDATVGIARQHADIVIGAPCGRARQLDDGARLARGDVLLFLHADSVLPHGFDHAVVQALSDERVVGGRFDVCLAPGGALLWLTGELLNLRSRLTRISTGDQAIFVRRGVYGAIGGFPQIPLMEDVAFSRALKRYGQVTCLRERVVTSSRRWRRHGVVRTILLMWSLRFLYFCGVSPHRLRRVYTDTR